MPKETQNSGEGLILGLDIGTNSIGWALLEQKDGRPCGIKRLGVRVFNEGVMGEIEKGRDVSPAVKRREARLRRRMLARRAQRLRRVASTLQSGGLLPAGDVSSEAMRKKFFDELDAKIFPPEERKKNPHTLTYLLRARALDSKLETIEIGRAIYHLAQRRGFLSNRKSIKNEKDDEGIVKSSIENLETRIHKADARTLGEYLSRIDPRLERIRSRWTSRKMLSDEFDKIWESQRRYHGALLSDEFKKKVRKSIFFQRPLRWDRRTIGFCELEPKVRRAPLATLDVQRFRLLQKLNDILKHGFNPKTGEVLDEEKLSEEERKTLAKALEVEGDISFTKIKKILKLPKGVTFNFEEGGEKKLIGNRTAAKLIEVFGPRWESMSKELKDRIVEDILSIQKPETQYRRGVKVWGLKENSEEAKKFGDIVLEPGHSNLSKKAISKLLPLMEMGKPYATARKELFGDSKPKKVEDFLPPLARSAIPPVRNPAVARALTEARKVVNGIIGKYGKPSEIRIELARDLKKSRAERKKISKTNQQNRSKREEAAQKVIKEAGIAHPSGADIEKWLLAEECNWICPYTGKGMNVKTLFGPSPEFDIEHIIPFSRCLDNTFLNKTLCHNEFNRIKKSNCTPWEYFQGDEREWNKVIDRVKKFKGDAAHMKLERFQLKDLESFQDFTERQLADTRYASRLAIEYLGLLYGMGAQGVDADHTKRIQAGRGQVTKLIRNSFNLNAILGGDGEKKRDDHRHHAIDATCIAVSDAGIIKRLSDASKMGWFRNRPGQIDRSRVEKPWPGFSEEVKKHIESMVVSHRISKKANGSFHDETLYSKPYKSADGSPCVHVRKTLRNLSSKEVQNIVDPVVRNLVESSLGSGDPKKVFADPAHHPRMKSGVPINKVRIRVVASTVDIGEGARQRHVILGSNHHVEIYEVKDKDGKPRWDGEVVSTFEAARRLQQKTPVVKGDHGEGKKYVFSLAKGENIELKKNGQKILFLVRSISKNEQGYVTIEYIDNNDARLKKLIKNSKKWYRASLESLRKMNCRKVLVTPLGELRTAND